MLANPFITRTSLCKVSGEYTNTDKRINVALSTYLLRSQQHKQSIFYENYEHVFYGCSPKRSFNVLTHRKDIYLICGVNIRNVRQNMGILEIPAFSIPGFRDSGF